MDLPPLQFHESGRIYRIRPMREVLATAGAVFLALTLHAQVQIPDFLRGKSGQQLRSVGIILPDTEALRARPFGSSSGYLSLRENGMDASLHIYPSGGHGFGFQETFPYRPEFTAELDRWLREVILKQR